MTLEVNVFIIHKTGIYSNNLFQKFKKFPKITKSGKFIHVFLFFSIILDHVYLGMARKILKARRKSASIPYQTAPLYL
jgi:hypothetical protein